MNKSIRQKTTTFCNQKVATKSKNAGLSFYAFFVNKNDNPETINGGCRVVD